jgi:hypothetical protein
MSDERSSTEPSDDEQIVDAPHEHNPGTEDGVGEHVVAGMGDDGVRRMAGEFADLEGEGATPSADGAAADVSVDPSTREG